MLIAGKSGSQSPASSTPTLTLGSSESLNDPNPDERLADFYARDANVPSSNDQSGCSATDDDVVERLVSSKACICRYARRRTRDARCREEDWGDPEHY